MGQLTSVLSTITQTIGAVETLAGTVDQFSGGDRRNMQREQNLAMQQLQARQKQQQQEAEQNASEQRAQIQLDAQQEEQRRRQALRRAVARRNAKVGASGASRTGSNEAVLLGLINDSDDARGDNIALDQLRYNAIDNDLTTLRQRNILERTQLAEQQRLQRQLSRY